jgi:hypothetical protein
MICILLVQCESKYALKLGMYSQISKHLNSETFVRYFICTIQFMQKIFVLVGMNYQHDLLIYFQQQMLGIIQGNTNKRKLLVMI